MGTNDIFKSKLNLNIKGNCVERFIKRLKNNNIELINITYISKDEINIKVYKKDYEKIIELKTVYEINILDYYGAVKFKNNIINNKYIIIFILIALIIIYVLTSMIFNIEIVTNDSNMSLKIENELNNLGIKKYSFKKDYNSIEKIKKEILNRYRNEIEWIEIENIGTKYIVRYEPRIINKDISENELRNIVATKDCIIHSLYIKSGQIIKNTNSYVKKGDVIVSGYIKINDTIKDTISSVGTVYGETWYKVKVTYPYKYYESKETGLSKNVFVIKFLNKEIELFNFKKYKTKNKLNIMLLTNNLLPISFILQEQRQTKIIDENNTIEEVIDKAIKYSKNKIKKELKDGEFIKIYKVLSKIKNEYSITLNIFYSVVENVGKYMPIEEYKNLEE